MKLAADGPYARRALGVLALVLCGATTAFAGDSFKPGTGNMQGSPSVSSPALPVNAEFAFSATVTVGAPLAVDKAPDGVRRFIPITGGTVDGPMFTGKVLAGSGDWQILRSDGVISLRARYFLESRDGVRVAIDNSGLRDASPEVTQRMMRGDPVAASEYYFRTVAQIEAPVESSYAWMNRRLFVGVAERRANAAIVHFYLLR